MSGEQPPFTKPVADEPMPEKERAAFHADPEVRLRLAHDAASEPVRLSAPAHLVRRLVSRFELDGFPVVRTVVADLGAARYAGERRIAELDEQLVAPLSEEFYRHDEEREDEDDEWDFEGDPVWRRMQAGYTLDIAARGPGSRPMGFDAYHHAGLAFGDDWPALREELQEMLTGTST